MEVETEGIEGMGAADEGGVVDGVLVRVGDSVKQFAGVGREGAGGVEVEEGVKEEAGGGEEEAGDGGRGVELLAGADGGGAGALSEKRTEYESTLLLCGV